MIMPLARFLMGLLLASPALAQGTPEATPVETRIQELQAQALHRIQVLNADPSPEVQKEIEQIKRRTEIQILTLRLQQAEARADSAAVESLLRALEGLEHPERHRAPSSVPPRPAPHPTRR